MGNEMKLRVVYAHRSPGRLCSIEELFSAVSESLPSWVNCRVVTAPRGRADIRSVLKNIFWAAKLKDADLIHQTGDNHYAVLGVRSCPTVLTIHDLRFIDEAKNLRRWLFWWLWLYLPCWKARRVTVISEFTKDRLLKTCRVNPTKVRVIANCVSPGFVAKKKPWPSGPARLLVVGTTPNKNLERVAEACHGLPLTLVILGRLEECQKELLSGHGLDFQEISNLARQAVVQLYCDCDLVAFVSTYEGFGLPILEAQAVGRPVLTSILSPMSDVAGEGALKVDPFDVAAIRAGLQRLLTQRELREDLVQKGFENVKKYSASAIAAQYAALYREVFENS
jgi:glycosyltransferase involved in cell wall biosynthesis